MAGSFSADAVIGRWVDRRDGGLGRGQAAGVDRAEVSRIDVDVGAAGLGALDKVAALQQRPGELVGQVRGGFARVRDVGGDVDQRLDLTVRRGRRR